MPHTNRSKTNIRHTSNPTPKQIRAARERAGLTLKQAGAHVHTSWKTWQNWEAPADSAEHRRMHPATWELFQVKLAAAKMIAERELTLEHLRALGLYLPDK